MVVPIEQIMDKDHELLSGAVILGWTVDSNFLISYSFSQGVDFRQQTGYRLQFWKYSGASKPLEKAFDIPLFSRENLNSSNHLKIDVSETPNGHFIVHACPKILPFGEQQTNYVTILNKQILEELMRGEDFCVSYPHLKYTVCFPYPLFRSKLSFNNDLLFINTATSAVMVQWKTVEKNLFKHVEIPNAQQLLSPSQPSPMHSPGEEWLLNTAAVNVEEQMISEGKPNKKLKLKIESKITFDVEHWLEKAAGFKLSSLENYDFQIVKVSFLKSFSTFPAN